MLGRCFSFGTKLTVLRAHCWSKSVNKNSKRWKCLIIFFQWIFGRKAVLFRWQTTLKPISNKGKLLENSNLWEELVGEHSGLLMLMLNLKILSKFQENGNVRPLFQYRKRGPRKNHINPHLCLQFFRLVEEMPCACEGLVVACEVNRALFPISFWR